MPASERIAILAISLGALVLAGIPLGFAILQIPQADVMSLFAPRHVNLLANSLGVAMGATIIGGSVGLVVAMGMRTVGLCTRIALGMLVVVPALVPPVVYAMTWIDLLGPSGYLANWTDTVLAREWRWPSLNGAWGAAWSLGLGHAAVPAFAAYVASLRSPSSEISAARLARGDAAAFQLVVLPGLIRGVALGSGIVFLVAVTDYSVASLLQVRVYPAEIHSRFSAFHDVPGAIVTAIPVLVLGLLVFGAIAFFALSKRDSPREIDSASASVSLPRYAWLVTLLLACLALGVAVALPVAALLVRVGSPVEIRKALETAVDELLLSVGLAATAGLIVSVIAFVSSHVSLRRSWRFVLTGSLTIPFLLSGPAVSIALISAWNHADARAWVYDSPAILLLALVARFAVVAVGIMVLTPRSSQSSAMSAARLAGVGWARRVMTLALPTLLPLLLLGWGIVFALALRDADSGVLLAPPGYTTLPVRVFGLLHYGPSALVASLSVVILVVGLGMMGAAVAAAAITRRWLHGAY